MLFKCACRLQGPLKGLGCTASAVMKGRRHAALAGCVCMQSRLLGIELDNKWVGTTRGLTRLQQS